MVAAVGPGVGTKESAMYQQQPQRPNWWSRNWKWFVPVVCVAGAVIVAGTVAVIYVLASFVFSTMKSSGGYQEALAKARANPAVVQALGTPIKDGFMPTGNVDTSGSTGHSDLAIHISGPRGRGTLYVRATRSMGEWQFTELVLEVKGTGERIDLLAGSAP